MFICDRKHFIYKNTLFAVGYIFDWLNAVFHLVFAIFLFFSLVELHPWLNSVHARLCIAKEMHVLVIFCGSRVNSEAGASHLAESQSLVKHPHFMSVMKMIWLTCHLGVIYKMCCVVCLCCIYIFVHLSFFKNIFVLLSKDMRLSFINF